MVVFTCQHCGDSVKKPAVEKHYYTRCRFKIPNLTCVDCLKDFGGEDFKGHNECMTELQRYSANGTVFKEQKGKKKQEKYVEMIQKILNSEDLNLTKPQRLLLEVCAKHDNVPRKLAPFQNFIRNVARCHKVAYNQSDIQTVFDIIENAWKKEQKPALLEKKENVANQEEETENPKSEKNKTEEDSMDNKLKSDGHKKKKKEKDSNKSFTEDDTVHNGSMEEVFIDGEKEYDNQTNMKLKKAKIKSQSVEEGNVESFNYNKDVLDNESKKAKKKKHRERSECVDNEDVTSTGDDNTCNTDIKEDGVNEVKENVHMSKKQLKKQKKYEKYLAELENVTSNEGYDKDPLEDEEPVDSKKKKKKKLKDNKGDTESFGEKDSENMENFTMKTNGKQNKKRKLEDNNCETPEKKIKEHPVEGAEASTAAVFDWADVITRVLASRPDKELSLKKLGKKVVTEYQTVKPDHRTYEELMVKFNKKVNKVKGVRVLRDKAKLLE